MSKAALESVDEDIELRQPRVFWSPDYVAPKHAFDTTRKSRAVRDLVIERGTGAVVGPSVKTIDATEMLIVDLHDPAYIEALRTGEPRSSASSQGFEWDEGIWKMAVASTAGVISALELALGDGLSAGSLSSGLHHARSDRGRGFCTINGLAVAAVRAADLIEPGEQIVVLDVDAHCGGGTRSLIDEWDLHHVLHLDVSTNDYDGYDPDDSKHELHVATDEDDYMQAVDRMLDRIVDEGCRVVFYNAGMDAIESVSPERLVDREHIVAGRLRDAGIPCVFVLAGGYTGFVLDMEALADLHAATVEAFIGR